VQDGPNGIFPKKNFTIFDYDSEGDSNGELKDNSLGEGQDYLMIDSAQSVYSKIKRLMEIRNGYNKSSGMKM
jgi:hypothetical protein